MKNIYLKVTVFIFIIQLNYKSQSQSMYMYTHKGKTSITLTNKLLLKFKENISTTDRKDRLEQFGRIMNSSKFEPFKSENVYHSAKTETLIDAERFCNAMNQDPSVEFVNRYIVVDNKDTVGLTNEIFIKLKPQTSINTYNAYLKGLGVLSISQQELDSTTYILKFVTIQASFQHKSGNVNNFRFE